MNQNLFKAIIACGIVLPLEQNVTKERDEKIS